MKLRNKSTQALQFTIDGVVYSAAAGGPVSPELNDAKAAVVMASMTSLPLEEETKSTAASASHAAPAAHTSDPPPQTSASRDGPRGGK